MKATGIAALLAVMTGGRALAETEAELKDAIREIEGVKLGGSKWSRAPTLAWTSLRRRRDHRATTPARTVAM